MQKEWQENIFNKTITFTDPNKYLKEHTHRLNEVLKEIKDHYIYSVKRGIIEYKLLSNNEKQKFINLRIPIPPRSALPPFYGEITDIPNNRLDYSLCTDSIVSLHYTKYKPIAIILLWINSIWDSDYSDRIMLDAFDRETDEPFIIPSQLGYFTNHQRRIANQLKNILLNDWRTILVQNISDNFQGIYNMFIKTEEEYLSNPMYKDLGHIQFNISDQLRHMGLNTVDRYINMIELHCEKNPERAKSYEEYIIGRTPEMNGLPNIIPTERGDNREKVVNFNAISPPLHVPPVIYIEPPLFKLKLIVEDGECKLSPSAEEVENGILNCLNDAIDHFGEIYKVDQMLLSLITLPNIPLVDFRTKDKSNPALESVEYIDNRIEEVRNYIRQSLQAPIELAKLYSTLSEYITLDPEEEMQRIGIRPRDRADEEAGLIEESDPLDHPPEPDDYLDERETLRLYKRVIETVRHLSNDIEIFSLVEVDCREAKSVIEKESKSIFDQIIAGIEEDQKEICDRIINKYISISNKVRQIPEKEEELSELQNYIKGIEDVIKKMEQNVKVMFNRIESLEEFHYSPKQKEFEEMWSTLTYPSDIRDAVNVSYGQLGMQKMAMIEQLDKEKEAFKKDLSMLIEEIKNFITYTDIDKNEEYSREAMNLQDRIDEAHYKINNFNHREDVFDLQITEYNEINEIQVEFKPYYDLWTTLSETVSMIERYLTDDFTQLDIDEIETNLMDWWKMALSLSKVFANQDGPLNAVNHMKEAITEFRKKLPLIQALTQKGLQERHWKEISQTVGFELNPDEGLNIELLLENGILDHLEEIQSTVAVASKEWSLEKTLNDMEAEWTKIAYEVVPYRETGTFVVRATDDIISLLDEQLVKTQTMRGSPFIGPIEGAVKDWEQKIMYTQKLLEEWMLCQRTWIYLEPIFSSEDIMNQMPKEARKFASVDSMWRKTMSSIRRSPMVMEVTVREGLINQFERANGVLEEIQSKLNEYLERKRKAFPRFFFLSNDELIEILAQTKDPRAVQPHLNKSFEGIHHVTFTEEYCITHIQSAEKEEIELISPVDPNEGRKKGNVELWMTELEEKMILTMKELYYKSLNAYPLNKRTKWVFDWPGQIILAVNCTIWTQEVEQAITAREEDAIKEYEKYLTKQLNDIVELVRGEITFLQRQTLGALTVIDVHARDVVHNLAENDVYELDDFNWMSQLRYYYNYDENQLNVKIVNAETKYMYEYIGNSTRLVITPLTDRCYRTLMGAVYLTYGGAPEGPAGTGKTESVKDLSKAVATQCVVFNCSDGLDYLAMAKFFKGLAASGAWSCFDEFNRIDLEVLSVIAQQILTIQKAKQEHVTNFIFEGTSIPLRDSCNVFITMNPGYAGRSELPDNLKSLFRPCAMMVPDYALIAEITLYSYGFTEARLMARKLVRVLRLCSEQLSSQDHYDYGMRAVKAILLAAGNLRRKEPNERQDILTLRAITDVNLPKFTSNDIPLFQGITSDLFPNVHLPIIDYGPLVKSMKDYCKQHKLISHDNFIKKCLQLYDTTIVRHGLMLVGCAYSGKTCVINTLSSGLSALQNMNDYENVKVVTINPKCITQDQLYGKFDENSHEWQDGVLAVQVRLCAKDTSPDKKWIVFDGPVDAVWIENMNTVLDDNKKLCLNSGEIIRLTPEMTIMFEVENLIVASPATVSRCGMVFMEAKQLGYDSLIQSWRMTLPESIGFMETFIFQLIDELIPPCLTFVMKRLTKPLPVTEMELTGEFLKLLTCELDEVFKDNCQTLPPSHELMSYFESIFVFSCIWTIGVCTDQHGRELFNEFLREHLSPSKLEGDEIGEKRQALKNLRPIPRDGTVYDYYFDKKSKKWIKWTLINDNKYDVPDKAEYNSIIVPTMDNIQISTISDKLMFNGNNVLLVGPTGTGKSVIFNKKLYEELPKDKWSHTILQLTATTTGNQVQTMIENKLVKRRKGFFGPTPGKTMIWFIDDMNLPIPESSGCQPPIELLRQWTDFGGWYELNEQPTYFKVIKDILMLVAMGTPGGGKYPVTMRLLRHFSIISVVPFNEDTLNTIFGTIAGWFLRPFPNTVRSLNKELVESSIELFSIISSELLPTPNKLHYTFNLRDLSKVFQGLSQASKTHIKDQTQMARLWTHESLRIFSDRLVDDSDREWFIKNLKDLLYKYFHLTWEKIKGDKPEIIFGDYIPSHQGDYSEIENHEEMKTYVQTQMEEYNTVNSTPLELVLFDMALNHMNRIARCIRHPQGHALLVGVGGSGRKSLSRLASYIEQYRTFEIEVSRSYNVQSWKDDLKKVIRIAGAENKNVCFIFCDTQIMQPSFMEDINALLNSGEVSNLYEPDELSSILETVGPQAVRAGKGGNNADMYNYFVEKTRANLHIILCFSPIGNAYKNNLRQFPSIVNCCYIDWFSEWPREALSTVGEYELKKMKFNDNLRKNILNICVDMQERVQKLCKRYLTEHHQHYYVTPMSYLGLMKTFSNIYMKRKSEMVKTQTDYNQGLQKLLDTESKVSSMKEELKSLQPTLEVAKEEVAKLIESISEKQTTADAKKEIVEKESEVCDKQAQEAQQIRDSCENDLSKALPILHAAEKALKKLSKADLVEVKSMTNPPKEVKVVMEVMCVFLREKLQGTYWETAKKKILNDSRLIDRLLGYNKEKMDDKLIAKILPYLDKTEFSEERVEKASKAAFGMCKWIRAMVKYYYVDKDIRPKKQALKESEAKLAELNAALQKKREELQGIIDHLTDLKNNYEEANNRKEKLRLEVDDCKTRLTRAEKLILALSDEKSRWADKVTELRDLSENIIGDSLLGSGIVSYLGVFIKSYREECITNWKKQLEEAEIVTTDNFSLRKCFGDDIQIRSWNIHHLPSDDFSVTNALILYNSNKYPLMIDPQGQASRWIKSNEVENGLKIIRQSANDFVRTLQNCVQFGKPVLIDNVAEDLDAVLDPLLLKQLVRIGGVEMIKVGDSQFKMEDNFYLYMITKLRAPHYPPETCVKVNLLNFMATEDGLSDQMLGIVVKKERAELEERREKCLIERSENQKELKRIENKILQMISSAEGNILDDENLINALSESKTTSNDIAEREVQAERAENIISATREKYEPVSHRASLLFFCISDLAGIDNMYQYSLEWFVGLFNRAIEIAPKSNKIEERSNHLISSFTYLIYTNVCRSLFGVHHLLFSFLMCTKIMSSTDLINMIEYKYFLTGNTAMEITQPNPCIKDDKKWLDDSVWKELWGLHDFETFKKFIDDILENPEMIISIPDSIQPEEDIENIIEPYEFSSFQKLIIKRFLRLDKLVSFTQSFICENMEKKYVESPPFDLNAAFNDSTCVTPIIFMLSPGADPMTDFFNLAEQFKYEKKLKTLSLGQGQGPIAEAAILEAVDKGTWVVLQNCHLAVSWLPILESLCENITEDRCNPNFRLWLTSKPTESFPVSILQNGIKITKEAPKGLRSNLIGSYLSYNNKMYDKSARPKDLHKLLFGLSFFHALVQERRKYGPLGWNISYEFNDSDLRISIAQLELFLSSKNDIRFDALLYLTGECNYGGRVTDYWDRRTLNCILEDFYNPDMLENNYYFSEDTTYYVPEYSPLSSVIDYIKTLPLNDGPAVFGLHQNADITCTISESNSFIQTLLSLQPRTADSEASDSTNSLLSTVDDLRERIPDVFDVEGVSMLYPVKYEQSMNTVLQQELQRYNKLLSKIDVSLEQLKKAIKGLIVMSIDLEAVSESIEKGLVPELWKTVSYPSLKPLGSWIKDLGDRVEFFKHWIDEGPPDNFWISGFFFTQSFLTGILQNCARAHQTPIDALSFDFHVLNKEQEDDIKGPPKEGCYIHGLYLEGARWNEEEMVLDEQNPKELYCKVPTIELEPKETINIDMTQHRYICPVYKTSERRGVLSTTGHSTNFVVEMYLPMKEIHNENHWVKRGTALLTQLNN